ncbi:MAG: methyltransferase domain-containing protein [Blastocatellia bacterium]
MEIERAHAHDVHDGHSARDMREIGVRSASKIEMAAYRNTPHERERISDLMNIIPKGRDSVLDVGARDGYLSRLLTEHFASVTALDLEKPLIAHDRITCVEGDVTRLELAGDSFDVVLCAEVLEHIPGKGLEQACRELSRVAKSYVVIGVPYRQDTRLERTTCQSCGRGNPPWGHVNVFDERRLAELFLPLQKVGMTFVGSSRSRTNALSSWLMDIAGNPWGTYDQEEVCIHCGQEIGKPAERNVARKLCSKLAFSLNAAQSRFISARPNWIHMVFEKHRQIESGRHSLERSAPSIRSVSIAAPERTSRRLLFIAYQFAPSLEMGARSCAQIARYLPRHGWSPVVLTAQEKYIEERYRGSDGEIAELGSPDAIVRTRLLPHPLDFYRWLKSAFRRKPRDAGGMGAAETAIVIDGQPDAKGKLRRSILSALSIPDIYTGWILPAIVAGLKAARESKAEQIFSSGPFWTNHLVGLALSYLTGLPWTAHFRDPWITGGWHALSSSLAARLNKWLERIVVTRATSVVSVTEEHSDAFRRAYPRLPPDKFFTVPNGYDNEEWEEEPTEIRREQESEEKFLIAYTGKFYVGRDPQPLFRALRTLIDSGEIEREQVRVDLVGWCETSEGQSVREMAVNLELGDCVNILGPRSRREAIRRIRQADLLLLLAEKLVIQIPGKTYEYLRAGRPILALTSEGAVANFLRRAGAGWVVDPKDDAGVLGAVRERYRQWKAGERGPIADPEIIAGFDRRKLAGRLAELFDRLNSVPRKRHRGSSDGE